jgi:hypothetical protein
MELAGNPPAQWSLFLERGAGVIPREVLACPFGMPGLESGKENARDCGQVRFGGEAGRLHQTCEAARVDPQEKAEESTAELLPFLQDAGPINRLEAAGIPEHEQAPEHGPVLGVVGKPGQEGVQSAHRVVGSQGLKCVGEDFPAKPEIDHDELMQGVEGFKQGGLNRFRNGFPDKEGKGEQRSGRREM